MDYSFIISSVDRYRELQSCLTSIENAYEFVKNIAVEVIVVFKGEEDKCKFITIKYAKLFSFYTYNGINLSQARNIGIKESKGKYLIFMDDDATVKQDILLALRANIDNTMAGAFCGRILNPNDNSPFTDCYNYIHTKELNWFEFQYFMGSTIILKRDIIKKVGSFDENFGSGARYYAADDTNMFYRLKQANEKVVYLPEVVFYHSLSDEISPERVFKYSYAKAAMFTKQIINDKRHFFVYLKILLETILKSIIRVLQCFFSKAIRVKDQKFQYTSVLAGTITGIYQYLRFR